MKVLAIAVCLAVVSLGIFIGAFLWKTDPWRIIPPKDQSLLTVFHEHQKEFEKLENVKSESQIPQEVLKAFSGFPWSPPIHFGPTGSIRIIFDEAGVAIGPGWAKGIEYDPKDIGAGEAFISERPLDKVDGLAPGVYLRPIEPHWYIFYQKDED